LGPEIDELEAQLRTFTGAKHVLSCANGTDALLLALMAKHLRPNEVVFVPNFTFAATAEAIAFLGGIPLFVDVREDTFNLDPESLKQAVAIARHDGLTPVGVIAVDLFGQPADYVSLHKIARNENLWIIADCAQSFGATYGGQSVCACRHCDVATVSFFPSKPLGCYGDAGAVFTNDDALFQDMHCYRVHGQGTDKYDNQKIGLNARCDTVQAAVLLEKLKIFPDEMERRNAVAEYYRRELKDCVQCPVVAPTCTSVWAQYTLRMPDREMRDGTRIYLKRKGIPSVVYYPKPLHLQTAYQYYPTVTRDRCLRVGEALSSTVLSIPMSAYVTEEQSALVVEAIRTHLGG
jgi:dTDP-4-amino-4,6-dideoxygalactose transaminase